MMTEFVQQYAFGQVRYAQATFLELVTDTEVHRIDFRGKVSWRLQRSVGGAISFHQHHPLLAGVQGPSATLMATATRNYLTNPAALVADIRRELQAQAGEWYDFAAGSWAMWWHRLYEYNIRPDLTRTGGMILNGIPLSVAQAVAAICTQHGVETYGQSSPPESAQPAPAYQLLLIGRNYVIAREFFVSTLCGGALGKRPRVCRSTE